MNKILKISFALFASINLSSCLFDSDDEKTSTPATPTESQLFIWTTDFKTGELRWLVDGKISNDAMSFSSDVRMTSQNGLIYILDRKTHNFAQVDPSLIPGNDAVLYQVSLPEFSNPEDLVVKGTTGYIAFSGTGFIAAFNATTGKIIDSLDISIFSPEGNTTPRAVDVELIEDTLIVLMQRLELDWSVLTPGLIARFNIKTNKLIDTLQLKGYNPQTMLVSGSTLYVGSVGDLMDATNEVTIRNLEKVDFATKKTTQIITSKELGGGIHSFAIDAKNKLIYIAIYKSWGDAPIAQIDAETGDILKASISGVSDGEGGIIFDAVTETLYVGDRSTENQGVKTFKKGDTKFTAIESTDMLAPNGFTIISK